MDALPTAGMHPVEDELLALIEEVDAEDAGEGEFEPEVRDLVAEGIQVRISAAGGPFHPGHSSGVGKHGEVHGSVSAAAHHAHEASQHAEAAHKHAFLASKAHGGGSGGGGGGGGDGGGGSGGGGSGGGGSGGGAHEHAAQAQHHASEAQKHAHAAAEHGKHAPHHAAQAAAHAAHAAAGAKEAHGHAALHAAAHHAAQAQHHAAQADLATGVASATHHAAQAQHHSNQAHATMATTGGHQVHHEVTSHAGAAQSAAWVAAAHAQRVKASVDTYSKEAAAGHDRMTAALKANVSMFATGSTASLRAKTEEARKELADHLATKESKIQEHVAHGLRGEHIVREAQKRNVPGMPHDRLNVFDTEHGVGIHVTSGVHPAAYGRLEAQVASMTTQPGIKESLATNKTRVFVYPEGTRFTDHAPFAHLRTQVSTNGVHYKQAGGVANVEHNEHRYLATSEGQIGKGNHTTTHELAHAIHFSKMDTRGAGGKKDPLDRDIRKAFELSKVKGNFPSKYGSSNHYEHWAEASSAWHGKNLDDRNRAWMKANDPFMSKILTKVYGDK